MFNVVTVLFIQKKVFTSFKTMHYRKNFEEQLVSHKHHDII